MNFTSKPPTKPGFYAWRLNNKDPKVCLFVIRNQDFDEPGFTGQWCHLLPAEEVEKAFREGMRTTIYTNPSSKKGEQDLYDEGWNQSNARKVVEGIV